MTSTLGLPFGLLRDRICSLEDSVLPSLLSSERVHLQLGFVHLVGIWYQIRMHIVQGPNVLSIGNGHGFFLQSLATLKVGDQS